MQDPGTCIDTNNRQESMSAESNSAFLQSQDDSVALGVHIMVVFSHDN